MASGLLLSAHPAHLQQHHNSSEHSVRPWSSHHHACMPVLHPHVKPSTSPPAASGSSCLLLQQHYQQRRDLVAMSAAAGGHDGGSVCSSSASHPQSQQQHRSNSSACGAGGLTTTTSAAPAAASSLGWNNSAVFFSKFRLGEQMGAGSYGTVYAAQHMHTGASYAVKVLQKRGSGGGVRGMQLDAIQREVQTWQQAQGSKFVAKLEGLFEDEQHAYIVQELCAGGSLRDYLSANNGTCSEQEAASVMQGVLDLLVECHRRHICFGDVKPANIMLKGQQQQQQLQVRAVDFGCSHCAKGVLTQTCGSPLYMAPEVALQRYGVGADVWSAGVLLYQMLTGHLPFWPRKTLAEVAQLPGYEIIAAIRTHEIEFPRALWAHISPQAQDLVARMLDRDPAARITAAQALQHPWLSATLGFTPTPSGDGAVAAAAAAAAAAGSNNVVEFGGRGARSPTLRPVMMSPSSSSAFSAAASVASSPFGHSSSSSSHPCGPLSPQKSSPMRSMLSGELPPSVLIADMLHHRAASVAVPATE